MLPLTCSNLGLQDEGCAIGSLGFSTGLSDEMHTVVNRDDLVSPTPRSTLLMCLLECKDFLMLFAGHLVTNGSP